MADLFASGRIVDLILMVMYLEAIVLIIARRWFRSGPATLPLAFTLLSGAALVLALRVALTGGHWLAIALLLVIAFAAHLLFVAASWEKHSRDAGKQRGR